MANPEDWNLCKNAAGGSRVPSLDFDFFFADSRSRGGKGPRSPKFELWW